MISEFKDVSIIIAAINETFSLEETVEILLDEIDYAYIHEIITVVCEKTTQDCICSATRCQEYCAARSIRFQLLYQKRPFAGGAYQDGFDVATGSHILIMSADLETDPHTAKDMIAEAIKYPNDLITCSRWLTKGAFEGYNKLKFVLNWAFQKFFSAYYGVKLTDMTFGYRIAPTELMKNIKWEELKHPFFLETLLKPIVLGVPVHEVPTTWKAREEGESQNSLPATFKYLGIAFRAKRESPEQITK